MSGIKVKDHGDGIVTVSGHPPTVAPLAEAAWQKEAADRALTAVAEAKEKKRKRRAAQWIPTGGEDMTWHDFGCEWVWLIWTKECPLRMVELSPSYFVVRRFGKPEFPEDRWLILTEADGCTDEHEAWIWGYVTHYQPEPSIGTPEPPE